MDIALAIISGGAMAAIVSVIGQIILARQARRYQQEDHETADIKALKAGVKWLLYDRIRFLGLHYIEGGAVDFDDRRILREMFTVYHIGLDGNGDLDQLMQAVDRLPITKEGKRHEAAG